MTRTTSSLLAFRPDAGLIAALLGFLYIFLLTSRVPLAVSADGTVFLELAESIRQGMGPRVYTESGTQEMVTHWPPFYPMALALLSYVGSIPAPEAARWLSALCMGGSLWVFDRILRRIGAQLSQRSLLLLTLGTSMPFGMYTEAMSEGLFIFLELCLFATLLRTESESGLRYWLLAGFLAGLMLLTRYAGLGLAGAAGLYALLQPGTWRQRLVRALCFGLPVLLLLGLWVLYVRQESLNPTNRSLVWHPVSLQHFRTLAGTLIKWLSPAWPPGGLIVLLMAGAGALRLAVSRRVPAFTPPAYPLAAGMALCYGLFLLVSVSLFDFYTPLDNRMLAPAFPLLLLLLLPVFQALWQEGQVARYLAVATTGIVLLSTLWGFSARSLRQYRYGRAYMSVEWRQSALLEALKQVPPGKKIYSNGRDAIRLHMQRYEGVYSVPMRLSPVSQQQNPTFGTEMADMQRALHSGEAVLVWFSGIHRYYLPDSTALAPYLEGLDVRELEDGFMVGE